ncbi:lipopolysaccharide biosynthesis protein [bacterium]|jgi:O-antigen/teichoic acid export membrane protein|nr:lipopolysaccharide biosynthesis protein [bacterium]
MKIISGLFSNDGTLSQKTVRGGVWIFGSLILSRILFFVRTIILAKLLMPNDFGLMGIAVLTITGLQLFSETGITYAIVQKKNISEDVLNTAWVMSILRGTVLFIVLFSLSHIIATFYNNLKLEAMLRVLSFSFLFIGFQNVGIVLFQKDLNFKKRALFITATDFVNIVLTVVFAFVFKSVWAMVIGHLVGNLTGLIVSYMIHPFKPSFKFNPNIAKELFNFGKHVFGSSIMIFFVTQGDDALVGKILGLDALGFYVLAYSLSNSPATAITHVISQVSFPAYSKVQDDLMKLSKGYLEILKITSLLAFCLAGGLFILAPEFIRIVYGDKWLPMLPAVLVLCFLGIFRSIGATMGPIFFAVGKPYIQNKIKLFELIVMVIIIYPLVKFLGIVGAALAGTIVYLLSLIFHYYNLVNICENLKVKILKVVMKPFLATLLMIWFLYLLKNYIFTCINLPNLIIIIGLGISFYMTFNFLFDKSLFKLLKTVISAIT